MIEAAHPCMHADFETVALGPGGVIAAVGSFAGQLDLGPGIPQLTAPAGKRAFVTHVAPDGSTGWAKIIGNSGGADLAMVSPAASASWWLLAC